MQVDWRIESHADVRFATCALLSTIPTIRHGFGLAEPADEPLAALTARLGFRPEPLRFDQVHGDRLVDLATLTASSTPPQADGGFGQSDALAGGAVAIKTADCVPLLFASAEGRFVAAVHAGWRGTAAGIAVKAVERATEAQLPLKALRVAIGPAIGRCCYQVDRRVVEGVAATLDRAEAVSEPDGERFRIDLQLANRLQLERSGLDSSQISVAPWCTHCSELPFHSFRREGESAGRQWSLIGGIAAPA